MTVTKESRDKAAEEASRIDDAHDAKRMARLDRAELTAINANRHDPRIELTEMVFEVIPWDEGRFKELLHKCYPSLKLGEAQDEGPAGLPAPKASRRSEWATVYQSDGETIATDIERVRYDDAATQRERGLVPIEDSDGNIVAYKKRPIPATKTADPAIPAPPEGHVELVDTSGKHVRWISQTTAKSGSYEYYGVNDEHNRTQVVAVEKSKRRGGWRESK